MFFRIIFDNPGVRYLHSTDLDDMRNSILGDDDGPDGGTPAGRPANTPRHRVLQRPNAS